MESAFPGVGDFLLLQGKDHINICKPVDNTEPMYRRTLDFLQAHLKAARASAAGE